jgi:hypothetical protein
MKFRITLTPEVNSQILSMSAYFEGVRDGLGEEFEAEVWDILKAISRSPEMYAIEFGPVRRALIRRFNILVFYSVEPKRVTVHELRDARRKRPNWRTRGFRDN